jgi:hypothetical protein
MGSFLLLVDLFSPPLGEKTAFRLLSDSSLYIIQMKENNKLGSEIEFENSLSMTSSQYVTIIMPQHIHVNIHTTEFPYTQLPSNCEYH